MSRFLWEQTRDLHHACEAHPIGEAMASGKPPMRAYEMWIRAIGEIHKKIDPTMPSVLHRVERLELDAEACAENTQTPKSAVAYAETLNDDLSLAGASYVLTGAHLMGGEIMRRRLDGYPTNHLEWDDRREAIEALKMFRERQDIVEQSRDCFAALLSIMDEIQAEL